MWVDGDGEVAYSGISPDNYYLVQAFNAAGLTPEPIRDARRRMVETTRRFEQQIDDSNQPPIDGSALFGTDISWTAYYNYGRRTGEDVDYGQFSAKPIKRNGPISRSERRRTTRVLSTLTTLTALYLAAFRLTFLAVPGP